MKPVRRCCATSKSACGVVWPTWWTRLTTPSI
jgi:hypothetical protein